MIITDTGTRIDLPILETVHRKDVDVKDCYLILYPTYLEYKSVAKYMADDFHDADGIWKESDTNYRWTRLKKDITQVDMYKDNPEDKWMVSLEFNGITQVTGWLFNSPKDALKVYTQLQDYFLGKV